MTDIETLSFYRLRQAEETLADAKGMLRKKLTARSITNRAYYSMFYAVLALFLKTGVNIKTSKHIGIISIFDKDFVHTGKIDKQYSRMLHKVFDARQEGDYKELAELSHGEAAEFVKLAEEFMDGVKSFLKEYEKA
jgi:uncharacterized protein (UPF0332 family)